MIQTRVARVFARWVDDPTECPFAFDVIMDPGSMLLAGDWAVFGATDLDGENPRPFLLDASGALHFGTPDRAWRTDFRTCRLSVKERFRVWWSPQDCAAYEIVKLATLGAKSPPRGDLAMSQADPS